MDPNVCKLNTVSCHADLLRPSSAFSATLCPHVVAIFTVATLIATCRLPPLHAQTTSCPPGPKSPSVTVCLPVLNSRVGTPAHVVASTTNVNPVTTMQIYVDNKLIFES